MIKIILVWLGLLLLVITIYTLRFGMLPHEWAIEKIKGFKRKK